jgi:hypothetical protein
MLRCLTEHVRDFALGGDDELPPPIWRIHSIQIEGNNYCQKILVRSVQALALRSISSSFAVFARKVEVRFRIWKR